jgi:hypothetical protein
MTIWSAVASACRRAARLGVLPTASLDWSPVPGRFADDDGTGGDADTDQQVLGGRRPLDGMNDLHQSCPHGTLGVFFVRGGPAEVGQDPIADVAGDNPS